MSKRSAAALEQAASPTGAGCNTVSHGQAAEETQAAKRRKLEQQFDDSLDQQMMAQAATMTNNILYRKAKQAAEVALDTMRLTALKTGQSSHVDDAITSFPLREDDYWGYADEHELNQKMLAFLYKKKDVRSCWWFPSRRVTEWDELTETQQNCAELHWLYWKSAEHWRENEDEDLVDLAKITVANPTAKRCYYTQHR